MFLREGVLDISLPIGGFGGLPPGFFSKINSYFLQSDAFCDHFHEILKVQFP